MAPSRIDEIANMLYDIATKLDEIEDQGIVSPDALEGIRQSVEKATDTIDRLENGEAEAAKT